MTYYVDELPNFGLIKSDPSPLIIATTGFPADMSAGKPVGSVKANMGSSFEV